MGQNGAGKSTLFGLITGKLKLDEGDINLQPRTTIAVSRQIIPRDELKLTVREFFQSFFAEKIYEIDPKIDEILEVVNLVPAEKMKAEFKDRVIGSFSGGQQARLLLASALDSKARRPCFLMSQPTILIRLASNTSLTS
jgi:ABC-type Mn2+/Zn2+ transport system ATPase subunit